MRGIIWAWRGVWGLERKTLLWDGTSRSFWLIAFSALFLESGYLQAFFSSPLCCCIMFVQNRGSLKESTWTGQRNRTSVVGGTWQPRRNCVHNGMALGYLSLARTLFKLLGPTPKHGQSQLIPRSHQSSYKSSPSLSESPFAISSTTTSCISTSAGISLGSYTRSYCATTLRKLAPKLLPIFESR